VTVPYKDLIMKNKISLSIIVLVVLGAFSFNAMAGVSGMLLVAEHDGKHFALLVKDRSRAYFELPAGKTEQGDKLNDGKFDLESSYETALRETVEETRGYLGRRLLVSSSNANDIIKYGVFDMFLSKIPMFDLAEINQIRIPKGNNAQNQWDPMREIIDYAWVNIANLHASKINNVLDITGKAIQVHYALPEEIRIAQTKGWFN